MNTRTLILAALTICSLSVAASGSTRYDVVLSPTFTKPEREKAADAILELVLRKAHLGDTIRVLNALTLAPVIEMSVPDDEVFANPRARLTRFRNQLAKLKTIVEPEATIPAPQQPGELHLPKLFDTLSQLRTGGDAQSLQLVLFAQPFHHDAGDPAFDFGPEDGSFPSDGYLGLPKNESIFSAAGREKDLLGVTVHWAWLTDCWQNHLQAQYVTRWWHCYLQSLGASLATFTTDSASAVDRGAQGITTSLLQDQADLAAKPQMCRYRRAKVMETTQSSTQAPASSANTGDALPTWLSPQTATSTTAVTRQRAPLRVGIRWGDNPTQRTPIDLDAYLKPTPTSREVYFKVDTTPDARLYKDWVQSPTVANGFETVETNGDIDITQATFWVNFFAGNAPTGVDATVRVWFDDKVFERRIHIAATQGNHGQSSNARNGHSAWVALDLAAIVGLQR